MHRSGQHTLRSFDRSALTWPQARVSTLERASHLVSRFFCAFSFRPCFQSPREFPCVSSTPKFHLSNSVDPIKAELANGEFFEIKFKGSVGNYIAEITLCAYDLLSEVDSAPV